MCCVRRRRSIAAEHLCRLVTQFVGWTTLHLRGPAHPPLQSQWWMKKASATRPDPPYNYEARNSSSSKRAGDDSGEPRRLITP